MANVLIVDDNVDVAELSAELLESAGHHVRKGHNGAEGLRSMSSGPLPDCVLLDVEMPVLDGPAMAHEMRLTDAGKETIPIVLVSGRTDLPAIAGRMGTPYFVAKACPGYSNVLLEMIERALREKRAPATA